MEASVGGCVTSGREEGRRGGTRERQGGAGKGRGSQDGALVPVRVCVCAYYQA